MQLQNRRERAILVGLFFVFLILISWKISGFVYDIGYWAIWAKHNLKFGLSNAYGSGTNYTPLFHYFLWAFGHFQGSPENIDHFVGFVRVFPLAADFLALYLVYCWIDRKLDYVVLLLFSMLNLAYSYDTIIWGQVDSILAVFAFAAIYFLTRDRLLLSGLMIVLMLNMKLQGIVLIPLWGLLAIEYLARTRRWIDLLYSVAAMIVLQVLIVLPFAFGSGGLGQVWEALAGLVGSYPRLSMGAHNFWFFLYPHPEQISDSGIAVAGLSYQQLGLILFCLFSLITFIPLLQFTIRQVFRKRKDLPFAAPPKDLISLTAAIQVMLFFFFTTQMHERYIMPAFIFLTAFAFNTRRFGLYTLFSIAVFLNLERVLRWFELTNYDTVLFSPSSIAGLFACCIVWTGILLCRVARRERQDRINPSF